MIIPDKRYQKSNEMLQRALKVIPIGSQTFSKSYQQFPEGHAPLFLDRGAGSHVWDVDGNEYLDLISALLPVVLGYGDPDVDTAITDQLKRGITMSLATELEILVAERLVELIPCAEMVRFGKNGSDATTAAIRVARAVTGRERIAVGGYHGWHDWYVGATVRNKGVPKCVSDLTHRFPYNDIDALDKVLSEHDGGFAAVIMEPMNIEVPGDGYLQAVKNLAHQHGALFVMDEVITGFRYALGGAQEYFGVTPDLASFGKSLANGMPLSALVGKAEYMAVMDDIFVSATFGGECLSLAAALAVLDKMQREPVIETLWKTGADMAGIAEREISGAGLTNVFSLAGLDPWKIMMIGNHDSADSHAIKTLFMKEMLAKGVLIHTNHNVSYAHDSDDLSKLAVAYRNTFSTIRNRLDDGTLTETLGCPVIHPVFSVR